MKRKNLSGKVNFSLERYESFATMPIEKKIKLLERMNVGEKVSTGQSEKARTWEDAS